MKIPIYQIDAFSGRQFAGNPAAVCPLEFWPEDEQLQRIAAENNLSETAFFKPASAGFEIRWFTPKAEVQLCGHATLASAFVLFEHLHYKGDTIQFKSRHRGLLTVTKKNHLYTLNFPADRPESTLPPENLIKAIGKKPMEIWKGTTDYLLLYPSQEDIEEIHPDFSLLSKVDARGIIVTSPGYEDDFVSRFFAPRVGITEDPVTGSAHTLLTPFWAHRLNKLEFTARQLSKRGGELICRLQADRVFISGEASTFLVGHIYIM